MPITQNGWELLVRRQGLQKSGGLIRTYGTYQVYRDGVEAIGLSGAVCECPGPGDNSHPHSGKRIKAGRYQLQTQFGRYRTIGYSQDTTVPAKPHMPGIDVDIRDRRKGILVHPGHPPDLYLSSIGCLNPTKPLTADQSMDFWDSRTRVIALIDSLHEFDPSALRKEEPTHIANAWLVVDGEPMTESEEHPLVASR